MSIVTVRSAFARFAFCAALGLVLCATPASAAFRSFSIPVNAVGLLGATDGGGVINLPDNTRPAFTINFVLPLDYRADGAVRIIFYLSTFGAPCNMRLVPIAMERMRPGVNVANSLDGLSGNTLVPVSSNGITVAKQFVLRPSGLIPPDQSPGDGITVYFRRETNDASDTCASAALRNIDIQYPVP